MKKEEWCTLLQCASMGLTEKIPVALIADSPWIPGYTGISTLDYFTDINIWWGAQRRIRNDFPDVIFLPDYWVEIGMAAEPSGFGCKVIFFDNQPPAIEHLVSDCDDIVSLSGLKIPNPERDGLMPIVLNYYRRVGKLAGAIGEDIKIVASRGPLNIATHIMGVTEFLMACKIYPKETHNLLKKATALVKNWLEAQAMAVGAAEGIMLLDDIIGFMSPEDYMEFAHPYFREIFIAFPVSVRILHNDTENPASYPFLADMGINIFNFTYKEQMSKVRALTGDSICLMGNLPPLHVLTNGTPADVEADSLARLNDYGCMKGLIFSAGGGASPGMPAQNVNAMIRAAKNWGFAGT